MERTGCCAHQPEGGHGAQLLQNQLGQGKCRRFYSSIFRIGHIDRRCQADRNYLAHCIFRSALWSHNELMGINLKVEAFLGRNFMTLDFTKESRRYSLFYLMVILLAKQLF